MVNLQCGKEFAVKMGKKKVMIPVKEVDMSAVRYEYQVLKGYEFFLGRFCGFSL